jgi:serine/threonine-protein kinase HipA
MGALSFEPPADTDLPAQEWSLLSLAQESQQVLEGRDTKALLELLVTGGSPQGARPKALVHYDASTQQISTLSSADGEPWLVKFQARGEHKEVCAIEQLYAHIARQCGIDIPETAYFDLSPKYAAFGIARFDREKGLRVPMLSLAALLHADFRVPAVDYTTFLRATRMLTRDEREVQKAFARAVFNVIVHNRDDHTKNFTYRLGRDRRWRLAPAYDVTFSDGPGGQHQMDVCGVAEDISRAQLLKLADQGGLDQKFANDTIERIQEVTSGVKAWAADFPIRKATIKTLSNVVDHCRRAVG